MEKLVFLETWKMNWGSAKTTNHCGAFTWAWFRNTCTWPLGDAGDGPGPGPGVGQISPLDSIVFVRVNVLGYAARCALGRRCILFSGDGFVQSRLTQDLRVHVKVPRAMIMILKRPWHFPSSLSRFRGKWLFHPRVDFPHSWVLPEHSCRQNRNPSISKITISLGEYY